MNHFPPSCPACGETMRFTRAIHSVDELPKLVVHECKQCHVSISEVVDVKILERAAH